MPDTWKAILGSIGTNSIFKKKVTTINPDLDAIAEESDDSMP